MRCMAKGQNKIIIAHVYKKLTNGHSSELCIDRLCILLSPSGFGDTSKFLCLSSYLGPKHSTFNSTPSDARNWYRDDAAISRRTFPSLPLKANREEGDGSFGLFSTLLLSMDMCFYDIICKIIEYNVQ
jgi:hypothetical protein